MTMTNTIIDFNLSNKGRPKFGSCFVFFNCPGSLVAEDMPFYDNISFDNMATVFVLVGK